MGNEAKITMRVAREKRDKDRMLCKPMRKLASYRKLDFTCCTLQMKDHYAFGSHDAYIIKNNTDLIICCFALYLSEYPIEMFPLFSAI
jgi:hypothetical protein